jgi:hypothetical protein
MTDQNKNEHLDEQLASFTDELLNTKDSRPPQLSADNKELRDLQEIVLLLKRTTEANHPTREAHLDIHDKLTSEFNQLTIEDPKTHSFTTRAVKEFKKLFSPYKSPQRRGSFVFVIAITIIIVIAFFISPTVDQSVSGTARWTGDLIPAALVVFVAAIGAIILWNRRRKK